MPRSQCLRFITRQGFERRLDDLVLPILTKLMNLTGWLNWLNWATLTNVADVRRFW